MVCQFLELGKRKERKFTQEKKEIDSKSSQMQKKRTVLRKQVENLFVLDLTAPLPKGGKGKV
jgi:Rps23 Pro-64 3,4-dihydroxylase Tpa1-like proline 4-hydroxylase